MRSAFLWVDVQNDFLPGGSLAVPDGDKILKEILDVSNGDPHIPRIWTMDWHPANHCSFSTWPAHCIQWTEGADISSAFDSIREGDFVVKKGKNPKFDSYSAFYDDGGESTGLTQFLRLRRCDTLYVGGLATEYCVKATVLDAIKDGFKVVVLADCCRGITEDGSKIALQEMFTAGAAIRGSYLTSHLTPVNASIKGEDE